MSESPTSCYVSLNEIGPHGGELFETTMLARASWYENGQHGGVLAALMTRAVDRQPSLTSMEVARVTVELFRVVPVDRLEVVTNLIREGKKIQTTEVRLYVGELEVAHGLVQRLRVTDLDRDFENTPAPAPLIAADVGPFGNVMPFLSDAGVAFGRTSVEVVEVTGTFAEVGAMTAWFRINNSLVDGESLSPIERAVITGDFSNGLTRKAEPYEVVFMNSDLSLRFARPPVGEWIALTGESIWERTGRGAAHARLFDELGEFAHAGQTLFLDHAAR